MFMNTINLMGKILKLLANERGECRLIIHSKKIFCNEMGKTILTLPLSSKLTLSFTKL